MNETREIRLARLRALLGEMPDYPDPLFDEALSLLDALAPEERVVPPLLQLWHERPSVRPMVAELLGRSRSPRALRFLERVLWETRPGAPWEHAVSVALARPGDDALHARLVAWMDAPDEPARIHWVAYTLVRMARPEGAEALRRACHAGRLSARDVGIRLAAMRVPWAQAMAWAEASEVDRALVLEMVITLEGGYSLKEHPAELPGWLGKLLDNPPRPLTSFERHRVEDLLRRVST